REAPLVQERAEAVIALCAEQGFPSVLTAATLLQGWALAGRPEQTEDGIARLQQGLAAWGARGEELWQPYFLALLAEAYGEATQPEEGLKILAKALDMVANTGERWGEAELYRLKGQLLLNAERMANDKETRPKRNDELNTSSVHRSAFSRPRSEDA